MQQLTTILKLIIFACIYLIAICIGIAGISIFFIADKIEDYLNRNNNNHI
jgi:hypothetical protein